MTRRELDVTNLIPPMPPKPGQTTAPALAFTAEVPYNLVMGHVMDANGDDAPWTTAAVRDEIKALLPTLDRATWKPRDVVQAIIAVLDRHGYDSVDRELSFAIAAAQFGWTYDTMYDAWLSDDS